MENNFDKIQKNAGVNTKLNQFAKLANQMNPISESVRKLIEMQDKLKFVIPDFDIPKIPSFILPKIEIPNFDNLFNYELLEKFKEKEREKLMLENIKESIYQKALEQHKEKLKERLAKVEETEKCVNMAQNKDEMKKCHQGMNHHKGWKQHKDQVNSSQVITNQGTPK